MVLFASASLFGQNGAKTCEILSKINTLLQQEHYQPKPIDDSLSVYVFDSFIDELDPNRNIFTKSEYVELCKHRLLLDDYLLDNNCDFIDDFVSTYQLAIERKKRVLEKIQKESLDYTTKDSVRFSKDNFPFDLTESDLDKIWKKRLRFDILEDISKLSKNLDSLKQHFVALEKASKAKIFDNNLCKVNSILTSKRGIPNMLQNDLFNIFCMYFDPHSNYFSLEARSNFMSALSTTNLSLGLHFGLNENEEIVVEDIVPGGPAAKTEKFEKDDTVVKVSNKKGEEHWVSCTSLDHIGEMIYSDSNKEIELTIRKKNGSVLDISLKKQIMKATENSVYSFIVQKEAKVGYINIPNFYSDFDGDSVRGCADDVAKEIVKLQEDNIEGLVIDLQDNGGGSMEEAIKLAGMFIDIGPVSVLSDSKNKQTILKDLNRGSVYNGPIVLLINGNSASASEFFSAALQDYNRAFILGAPSLGKASMQTIMPIDIDNQENFVKISVQKFYRVSGDSNQIKGVVPDVELPVLFDSLIHREKNYKTALKYDMITTKARYQKYVTFNSEKVKELSKQRVSNDERFAELKRLNDEINFVYNSPKAPVRLTFVDVFNEIHQIDGLWKKVKDITSKLTETLVSNTTYESEKLKFDSFQQEINSFKIKDVKCNPYLAEAIALIKDYNNIKN